ncbi:hypothetical protein L596_001745 [Steinernema carpocapsae]|uniref:Uncharacterized protein n=1 Tax=Steinernema carpocapsae TaxID=34508 RepID=A0A4V6I7H2_STECR|nr:hypothetical protein L596_001745 [Steinernema carpocapsae]
MDFKTVEVKGGLSRKKSILKNIERSPPIKIEKTDSDVEEARRKEASKLEGPEEGCKVIWTVGVSVSPGLPVVEDERFHLEYYPQIPHPPTPEQLGYLMVPPRAADQESSVSFGFSSDDSTDTDTTNGDADDERDDVEDTYDTLQDLEDGIFSFEH